MPECKICKEKDKEIKSLRQDKNKINKILLYSIILNIVLSAFAGTKAVMWIVDIILKILNKG